MSEAKPMRRPGKVPGSAESAAPREANPVTRSSGVPCVVSAAEHAGWAHLVCVSMAGETPAVIARHRVALLDDGLPSLPYHHDTIGMPADEANTLIARVRRSIEAHASLALQAVISQLSPGHRVVALAIREPVFPELPETVAAVHASYRLQCAADGVMYQMGLCRAARDLGLDVEEYPRGQESARAAERLRVSPQDLERFVTDTGRPAGPPWTLEHRRAYAIGIAALAAYVDRRLLIPAG